MHGVVNFLKPPGMTSHDAVAFVRRVAKTKRVGHTGTLDPAAAGVLPICIGQATRLVEYLQAGTKEYIAEATFGFETDTCDAVGEIVSQGDATQVNLESLRTALDPFRGTITQTPPMHSAIKIDGKKLYELAREGVQNIEIPTRQVTISQLLVSRFFETDASPQQPRAMIKIECSGGTYIRSLVRDIGRQLGCGATMTFLVRTRSGSFQIEDAKTPEEIECDFVNCLIPIMDVLDCFADEIVTDDAAIANLSQGKWTARMKNECEQIVFINSEQNIAALAVPAENPVFYKPEKVFFLDRDE
jgi:tRNA pseudouridine55 synthase